MLRPASKLEIGRQCRQAAGEVLLLAANLLLPSLHRRQLGEAALHTLVLRLLLLGMLRVLRNEFI